MFKEKLNHTFEHVGPEGVQITKLNVRMTEICIQTTDLMHDKIVMNLGG